MVGVFAISGTIFAAETTTRAAGFYSTPVLESGVDFTTADAELQRITSDAERLLKSMLIELAPGLRILGEGGGYGLGAWLESQPLSGEMYASRDARIGLNNIEVFLPFQREDGRLPAKVNVGRPAGSSSPVLAAILARPGWFKTTSDPDLWAHYAVFSGFWLAWPSWRMYFWTGGDRAYLKRLYGSFAAFDAYLWRTRDSNGDGLLETWCVWDTGEDGSARLLDRGAPSAWPFDEPPLAPGTPSPEDKAEFGKYWVEHGKLRHLESLPRSAVRVPFQSMDIMAYSYAARDTLARIALELGLGQAEAWRRGAEEVRQTVSARLWDPERQALFDRDRDGRILPELVHNNLRAMYHGLFTQEMADRFIARHLLNPREFWTHAPLPSIAAGEALYSDLRGNNWSGQPQGLTYLRAIRALENYGHHAELGLLYLRLRELIVRHNFVFPQQWSAMTGEPSGYNLDGYTPTLVAMLEYIARFNGVSLMLDVGEVFWSVLPETGPTFTYTQRRGDRRYVLRIEDGRMVGSLNGRELFRCSAGVRVVTGVDGAVREVVGIAPRVVSVTVQIGSRVHRLDVAPNAVWSLGSGDRPALLRQIPFEQPPSP